MRGVRLMSSLNVTFFDLFIEGLFPFSVPELGLMLSETSSVVNAVFNRSMDIFTSRPLTRMMKYFSFRFRTSYGPSYGGCKDARTASFLINTCVVVFNDLEEKTVVWL